MAAARDQVLLTMSTSSTPSRPPVANASRTSVRIASRSSGSEVRMAAPFIDHPDELGSRRKPPSDEIVPAVWDGSDLGPLRRATPWRVAPEGALDSHRQHLRGERI